MELGSATVRVLVEVAISVETRERGRIRHPFVEVADFLAAAHLGSPRFSVEGESVGLLNGREVLEGLGPLGGRCLRAVHSITFSPAFG